MAASPWLAHHQWWLEVYLASHDRDRTRNMHDVIQATTRHIGVRPPFAAVRAARAAVGQPLRNLPKAMPFAVRNQKLKQDRLARIKAVHAIRRDAGL